MENRLAQDAMQWNLPEEAKARLGKGKIFEIQYSPEGELLAVASGIGIWIYDTITHREVALLTEHTSEVSCLAFSPDGHIFASGSKDKGTVLLWDKRTGKQTALTGHTEHAELNLTFSPDGKTLVSGSAGTIRFWDAITGEQKATLTSETIEYNTFVSFSPDGETIVCGNGSGVISLWDASTRKHKTTLPGHKLFTWSMALSPDGKTIAMGV